jgi:hypothetical protein
MKLRFEKTVAKGWRIDARDRYQHGDMEGYA